MRKARLGSQGIEREAQRLKTLLDLGMRTETDDLGEVDFTTTTTGAWVDTGLEITITPATDVRALVLARVLVKHSAAQAAIKIRIYSTES